MTLLSTSWVVQIESTCWTLVGWLTPLDSECGVPLAAFAAAAKSSFLKTSGSYGYIPVFLNPFTAVTMIDTFRKASPKIEKISQSYGALWMISHPLINCCSVIIEGLDAITGLALKTR